MGGVQMEILNIVFLPKCSREVGWGFLFVFLAALLEMQDLNSLIMEQTLDPQSGSQNS